MAYEELLQKLKMNGFGEGTVRCFILAHDNGASDADLECLYFDLMDE